MEKPPVVQSVLSMIGRTPLVELGQVPMHEHNGSAHRNRARIFAKCEQMNPGGSVKDRVALALIEAAEAQGLIHPAGPAGHGPEQTTIVEPTSGNTGIGLALICQVKGYKLVLTMPDDMSRERRSLLRAYGADLILTRAEDSMDGAVRKATELAKQPGYYMPQQFTNPANPAIHRATTGPEILGQMGELSIDAFVAGVGTGGTITGVGQVLRGAYPKVHIMAVEPARSPLLSGGRAGLHRIQGIGADFVPPVLDRSIYDEVRTVTDERAWQVKQELSRREGLLVGISAGAATAVALDVAAELGPGKNVVVVLPDTGERYFSLDEDFR